MSDDEIRELLKGVNFTFSINCRSGLESLVGSLCECWRCRKARGEEPDEAAEIAFAQRADAAWKAKRGIK